MIVIKEITKLENSRVNLRVDVSKEDVRSEYDDHLKTYLNKDEALGKIIEKALKEIFEGEDLPREFRPLPYASSSLEGEPKLDPESSLQFSVVYDVHPEVKIEKWEGLEAEIPDVSITEEDINGELELIQERNSIVLDKGEKDTASLGDLVTIDYWELGEDGEELENGERKDFSFSLGSGKNPLKFDDEIVGMKKGEKKEFSITYADNDEYFSGKTKKIKLILTALKLKKIPALDDDLAQDVNEKFKTLEDLKNNIRQRLEEDLGNRIRDLKVNNLLEQIIENSAVEIPESMLEMELGSRFSLLAQHFNTDVNGLCDILGPSMERVEEIIESWKPEATKLLHLRLIIETLIEELKLESSDEEIEQAIERLALENNSNLEDFKKQHEDSQIREYLKESIIERKLFEILLSRNKEKIGGKVSYQDLVKRTQEMGRL